MLYKRSVNNCAGRSSRFKYFLLNKKQFQKTRLTTVHRQGSPFFYCSKFKTPFLDQDQFFPKVMIFKMAYFPVGVKLIAALFPSNHIVLAHCTLGQKRSNFAQIQVIKSQNSSLQKTFLPGYSHIPFFLDYVSKPKYLNGKFPNAMNRIDVNRPNSHYS